MTEADKAPRPDAEPADALRADVAAGILWRGRELLAVERPPGKPMAGYWEFPGGKAEPGESPEEALGRELHEELGVTVRRWELFQVVCHDYAHARVRVHFFHVWQWDGEPHPHEGHVLRWTGPDEAAILRFLPADRGVLEALGRRPPAGEPRPETT